MPVRAEQPRAGVAVDGDETIVGFIALLTLWRRGLVEVRQDALFSDIHVTPSATGMSAADD